MSHLQYFAYKGFGEESRKSTWYSQAVRVGDRIEISGQGGWDPLTSNLRADLADEIDQAFANVDLALKDAGGKGWSQVYKINMYAVDLLSEEGTALVIGNLKKWLPDHQPLLTFVGVKELAFGMRIEIEVVAHDEQTAKTSVISS
ncbi:endoribonuclease L-psp family protein [Rhexocercosporidium sp. MPI-PUGE-AT-0058]|nr:endoribonuclease L-psp family protein [Rhexocercosporidium sp. MPI-PUGE-AT-0058]